VRARRLVLLIAPRWRVPLCCALIAVTTSLAGALAVIGPHDFNPSVLIHMSTEPMAGVARATDPDFVIVPSPGHYDGVYYYAIGRDPLARGNEHTLIDLGGYRYEHPGFGWLAWLASAGQPQALPWAMLAAALACVGIAGTAAALLAADVGISPWWGLAVGFSPGLVFSVTVVTSEPAGLAALLVSILAWRRGRRFVAALALIAACLIKEPFLLVPVGIAIYECVRRLRAGRADGKISWRSFLRFFTPLAIGPLIFAVWYAYIWWQFVVPPKELSRDFTGLPFTGWVDTFKVAAAYAGSVDFNAAQVGAITIPLLVVVGFALVAGSIRSLRLESELQPIFILLALTAFTLNWWNLLYPKDLLRALTAQLVLLPLVFARGRPREAVS
jgi:hypothetical protein